MQKEKIIVHRPPFRLRYRPRLRTKTGCLTCRTRRKKCSERKPICHGCSNLSLPCVWPEEEATESHAAVKVVPRRITSNAQSESVSETASLLKPLLPARPNCLQYRPTTSENEDVLLKHFSDKYSHLLFQTHAHPGYRSGSLGMLAELKRVQCIIDLVYAISGLHLSNEIVRFNHISTEYYVSAIASLRAMVAKREVEGSEDWLMLMVIMFCLYERWRPDSTSNMSIHLRGAFQLLQLRMKKLGMAPGRVVAPMERMVAESVLCSTALVSLHVDFDPKMLEDLFKTASYDLQSEPFSGFSTLANSPFLAVGPGLYRVICKISQLCRRAPLRPEDQTSVDVLAEELRSTIASMDRALTLEPDAETQRKILPSKLYTVSANIMLYKLQHPSVHASHVWIQRQVREAIDIVQSLPNPFSPSQYLCWPMYIVGCAVVRDEDVVFVRGTLQSLWEGSYCGDLTRAARALETIWAAEDGEPSGLDMLLQRRSSLYQ